MECLSERELERKINNFLERKHKEVLDFDNEWYVVKLDREHDYANMVR